MARVHIYPHPNGHGLALELNDQVMSEVTTIEFKAPPDDVVTLKVGFLVEKSTVMEFEADVQLCATPFPGWVIDEEITPTGRRISTRYVGIDGKPG